MSSPHHKRTYSALPLSTATTTSTSPDQNKITNNDDAIVATNNTLAIDEEDVLSFREDKLLQIQATDLKGKVGTNYASSIADDGATATTNSNSQSGSGIFSFIRQYFNIDTDDVIARLVHPLLRPYKSGFMNDVIGDNPDMYVYLQRVI